MYLEFSQNMTGNEEGAGRERRPYGVDSIPSLNGFFLKKKKLFFLEAQNSQAFIPFCRWNTLNPSFLHFLEIKSTGNPSPMESGLHLLSS